MDAEASTSSVIKFPIVNRADYNDPASGIVNLDLFDSALLGSGDSVLVVPFPTGAFWTNFVVDPDPDGLSYPIVTYPFAYKWKDQLLQVSYPALRRRVDVLSIIDTFNPDVTFGSVESMSRRTILAFDPLSLTIRYATDSDDASWDTYLVHGSPYITAKYMETTPLLTTLSIFNKVMCSTGASYQDGDSTFKAFAAKKLTWSDCATPSSNISKQMTTPKGVQFLVQTQEELTWILFASEPVALTFDSDRRTSISTNEPFTGILRLTLIPPTGSTQDDVSLMQKVSESSGVKRLVYHANEYPIRGDVSWKFMKTNIGTIYFQFSTMKMTTMTGQQMDTLLMLGLPHHAELLKSSIILNEFDIEYLCIKGLMTPVIGSTWSYEEPLTSVGIDATEMTKPVDTQVKKIIMESVQKDLYIVLPIQSEDIYGYGKQIARLANLAHIASEMTKSNINDGTQGTDESYFDLLSDATEKLFSYLRLLLDSIVTDHLLYDVQFGGIVSKNGLMNQHDDFGNGRYNDHHFHYGYTLYACAIMGSLNATFVTEYGALVDNLMYDVAHQGDTSFFPIARHKSWFDSHSFASGLFPFSDGKSQESSSEAVNCYFGAYLWSTVRQYSNDVEEQNSIDFSRLLLATEIRGAQTYWHMTPQDTAKRLSRTTPIYVDKFAQNYMVGNLGMIDAVSSTWFGSDPLYVHMINFLPVTAITYELFDKAFVEEEYIKVIQPINEVPNAWKGYTLCDEAILEPSIAWDKAQALFSGELDSAISKSQILYWISRHQDFVYVGSDAGESADAGVDSLSASYCENNKGCVSLGLSGLCCPTSGGVSLGCCNSNEDKESSTTDHNTTDHSVSCETNLQCATLGLTGSCCPTNFGVMLGCCN